MAKVSVTHFISLVKRSKLVEDAQLDAAVERFYEKSDSTQIEDSEALSAFLVAENLLTRWQADNLLKGKHKGFILGKYRLLGHLGTGGMSSVYLAEHILMDRRVAIKVLPQSKVEDSSYLERFKLEACAAGRLNHANIVRAHDFDHEGNTHYLVMEFVDGRDLQTWIKQDGPLDFETAANFVAQAAEGLQHAHDSGLVHRDIKPANLLVDKHGTVKILDMGLAKFSEGSRPSLTLVHDENVLGTADYLAPEQAVDSHGVDHRVDIYSLGCTLYFVLTGHPPFPEGTLPQRIMKHQREAPASIYVDRPDAPADLVEICERMMAKTAEQRPQTASDVVHELAMWLAMRGQALGGGSGGSSSGILAAAVQQSRNLSAGGSGAHGSSIGSFQGSPPGALNRSSPGLSPLNRSPQPSSSPSTLRPLPVARPLSADEDFGLAPLEDGDDHKAPMSTPEVVENQTSELVGEVELIDDDQSTTSGSESEATTLDEEFSDLSSDLESISDAMEEDFDMGAMSPLGRGSLSPSLTTYGRHDLTPSWVWWTVGGVGFLLFVLLIALFIGSSG
jgi:serine/threonine protein kinase